MTRKAESEKTARPAGLRASASFFPELESLRGWAILLVFLFHADGIVTGNDRIGTLVSPLLAFITAGHTGVTLFFVLSAFLLARPFLEEGRGGRRVERKSFFHRRVLRIMPLYAAAILAAVLLSYEKPNAVFEGLWALFFLNSFTGAVTSLSPYSSVWWSLATEVQFYLALPLFGLALRTRTGRLLALAIVVAWAMAYAIVATDVGLLSNVTRFRLSLSIAGRAPAFLAGIAAAWIAMRHGEQIRRAMHESAWLRNGGSDVALFGVLFTLGLLLQKVTARGFIPAEITMPAWHVAESLLWTTVLLLVVLAPLRTRRLISNRVMGFLGLISYSIYLVHEPILYRGLGPFVWRGVPLDVDLPLRVLAFLAAFAVCVAISCLTYRFIERPFLVRKAKIER